MRTLWLFITMSLLLYDTVHRRIHYTVKHLRWRFFFMYRVLSSIAASLISLNKLTAKLNPIIRPIMDSVKREEDLQIQVNF